MEQMKNNIDIAMKRKTAPFVLKNCRIVNAYSGEIEEGDIAICNGIIVGIGSYRGEAEKDCKGAYAISGLIDSHMHIESTMLTPAHYAAAVLPYGVTTAIADPHEIANVCGIAGVDYMIREAATVPMDIKFMLPSCVPATPFENNGAAIDSKLIAENIARGDLLGLGEFMNYPGVLQGDEEVLAKLSAANKACKVIDGHYTASDAEGINVYALCSICTDHESTTLAEAKEKLKRGIYVQIREGSATRNLNELIGLVNARNLRRILFCTDDMQVEDLAVRGHIDNSIRMAVAAGMNPVDAVTIATLNAAECYGLRDRGAIAPGLLADILLVDNLSDFRVREVYKNGVLVARDGKALFSAATLTEPSVRKTMHAGKIAPQNLALPIAGKKAKVLRLLEHNVVTKCEVRSVNKRGGVYIPTENISKICVVERHKNTGNIGVGLLEGYGIRNGAIALSVAHDSHNIIAVGDNDDDIATAVNEIIRCGGGLTIAEGGGIVDTLALPVAGLMSDRDSRCVLADKQKLNAKARMMGIREGIEPFMSLSFLSLIVIPELKITDRGLFDVNKFFFTGIDAD